MPRIQYSIVAVVAWTLLAAGPAKPAPYAVKAVADSGSPLQSLPESFTPVNGVLYFTAEDAETGRELWRSDGTTAGTVRVKDIRPGRQGSNIGTMIDGGGTLFFGAYDGSQGGLWKSDGTSAGTMLVKALAVVSTPMAYFGGDVYFSALNGSGAVDLWRSDGTAAGTVLVAPLSATQNVTGSQVKAAGGELFFTTYFAGQSALWRTDGSPAGTVMLRSFPGFPGPSRLTAVGSTLFFVADDGVNGWELWKSNGTVAGTVIVKDTNPGAASGVATPIGATFPPEDLIALNGSLLFTASDGASGFELWKSDGTDAGTVRVADIAAGAGSSTPDRFMLVGSTVYFRTAIGGTRTLYRTDGTGAGTVAVSGLYISDGQSPGPPGKTAIEFGGLLYFRSQNGYLSLSDGSGAGTLSLPAPDGALIAYQLAVAGGKLFFALSGDLGLELGVLEGGSPRVVKDIRPGVGSFGGSQATPIWMNGHLYFGASDGPAGFSAYRMFKTDGTIAGTEQVRTTAPIPDYRFAADSDPTQRHVLRIGNLIYFRGWTNTSTELWRSDGTDAGTFALKDASALYLPTQFTNGNGILYFVAESPGTGTGLWRSDGTSAGTVLVKALNTSSASSQIDLRFVNGSLYFRAADSTNGLELWKSDGTTAGTVMVTDIAPGAAAGSSPGNFVAAGGVVYFQAHHPDYSWELWKTDGTAAGTVMVKDINPGTAQGALPNARMMAVGSTVFFSGDDGVHGAELWRSDGTAAGTVMVKDVNAGADPSQPFPVAVIGNTVYFTAFTLANGTELWKTDGTEAGTVLVKDIWPGADSSFLSNFITAGNVLYFSADDGVHGREVWRSDGTATGTFLVEDLNMGPESSVPEGLAEDNGRLCFVGSDGVSRRSLWCMRLGASPVDPGGVVNLSTRGKVGTGDNVLIGGFIIRGNDPRQVVVRARGPSLAQFNVPGTLADPHLRIVRSADQVVIAENDNWQSNAGSIHPGYLPSHDSEAAIQMTLQPGAYTAIVSGVGGTTGIALVEVFDIGAPMPSQGLLNIATRGQVLFGNEVMIGGFIIQGTDPRRVAVRARGPSMAQFGVPNLLNNPSFQLVRSADQVVIAASDEWIFDPDRYGIASLGLAPSHASEAASIFVLDPGAYTVIVSAPPPPTPNCCGTGLGIVEVFDVPR